MKNIILSMAVIITMAACQSKTDLSSIPGQSQIPVTPVYNNSALSDTAKTEDAFFQPARVKNRSLQAPSRSMRTAVHRNRYPEINSLPPVETSPVVTAPVPVSTGVNTVPASTGVGNNPSAGTTSTIPQPEKKGWSKAAKGAVIGAGAGAIGGAIFSKKKGLGAVIGGVIGAAGGYAIGKGMDKKDNRLVIR